CNRFSSTQKETIDRRKGSVILKFNMGNDMGYKRRILLVGCFFLFHAAAFSQGSITGTVIDKKTGETMPGTNVSIQSINKGASTDADGHYTINNIPTGTYTLTVSFIGYQKFSTQVQISDGEQKLDIALVPQVIGLD